MLENNTSQNVPSEAQVKNFFRFMDKSCSVFKIFKCIFNYPIIHHICDAIMSFSTLECIFKYIS